MNFVKHPHDDKAPLVNLDMVYKIYFLTHTIYDKSPVEYYDSIVDSEDCVPTINNITYTIEFSSSADHVVSWSFDSEQQRDAFKKSIELLLASAQGYLRLI